MVRHKWRQTATQNAKDSKTQPRRKPRRKTQTATQNVNLSKTRKKTPKRPDTMLKYNGEKTWRNEKAAIRGKKCHGGKQSTCLKMTPAKDRRRNEIIILIRPHPPKNRGGPRGRIRGVHRNYLSGERGSSAWLRDTYRFAGHRNPERCMISFFRAGIWREVTSCIYFCSFFCETARVYLSCLELYLLKKNQGLIIQPSQLKDD